MVTVYVGGKRVGPWAEAEAAFVAALARNELISFRDEHGKVIADISPFDVEPDWVKEITPEETARRMAEPGMTLEEWRKRQGEA
jgi:hypothetical protein